MALQELPVPADVTGDPRALELLRVWGAHRKQLFTINTHVWKDPAAWGLLLVDLARNIAKAYESSTGEEFEVVLARVKAGFDAEWAKITDL
jgi:hypothetical protein